MYSRHEFLQNAIPETAARCLFTSVIKLYPKATETGPNARNATRCKNASTCSKQ